MSDDQELIARISALEAKFPKSGLISVDGHAHYYLAQYLFVPDAAPAVDIATGDQQGNIYVSGPFPEAILAAYSIFETAPTGQAIIWEIEHSNSADLDAPPTWVRVARPSHTAGQKQVNFETQTDFSTLIIPPRSVLRFNLDQIGSTAKGRDGTIHLMVWRRTR